MAKKKKSTAESKSKSTETSEPKISYTRHQQIFDPDDKGGVRIDVIGAGATGSWLVLQLAKLGCRNIHVWDKDTVEEHNLPNQSYGLKHVGKSKVKALASVVKAQSGVKITTHEEWFTGEEDTGEIVFLLTDTMESRRKIWKNLQDNIRWRLLVETRMGSALGQVYCMEPHDDPELYEQTLDVEDDDPTVEESACGSQITVGMTAMALASMATWAFVEWCGKNTHDGWGRPPHEMTFVTRGNKAIIERVFNADAAKAKAEV